MELALGGGPLDVLCIGAHSDDIEIGCGGTLLRLLAERPGSPRPLGRAVGDAGARGRGAGERRRLPRRRRVVRRRGAPRSGRATSRRAWTEIKDYLNDLRQRADPDIVLCHHRHDEHQDHRTVAELAWNTWRNHLIAEYEIPKYEGDLGQPNVFVALAPDVAERKVELIMKHFGTQHDKYWFRPETFAGLMAVRGVEAGTAAAEAFHVRKLVL